MGDWAACKNILCVRADNMGDVLMSSPAIRALKETINCKITLLTSSMGSKIAGLIDEVDDMISFDFPWVKLKDQQGPTAVAGLVELLKSRHFDGCVIFTVYSQNPMSAIMIAYLANIPLRLAYCREHPYDLLTDWIPDPEPYQLIRHQVQRDLDLVANIGATTLNQRISLRLNDKTTGGTTPYLVLHPGVSEKKRKYPVANWIAVAKELGEQLALPIMLSGSAEEEKECEQIASAVGNNVINLAGKLNLEAFALLIKCAKVVVSVNTATIHIASAVQTPVVVLYAQTNPQHTPWMVPHKVLEFSVPQSLKSKNKVIEYVDEQLYPKDSVMPAAADVVIAVKSLIV